MKGGAESGILGPAVQPHAGESPGAESLPRPRFDRPPRRDRRDGARRSRRGRDQSRATRGLAGTPPGADADERSRRRAQPAVHRLQPQQAQHRALARRRQRPQDIPGVGRRRRHPAGIRGARGLGRAGPDLRSPARRQFAAGLRPHHALRVGRALRGPPRCRPDAGRDGRTAAAAGHARAGAGPGFGSAGLAAHRRGGGRRGARGAGADAAQPGSAVRRRLRAVRNDLDDAERDGGLRHPGLGF